MTEALRIILTGLVVASFVAIVAYMAVFMAAIIWTLGNARRPDPLSEELDRLVTGDLDRVLSEILGQRGTTGVGDR